MVKCRFKILLSMSVVVSLSACSTTTQIKDHPQNDNIQYVNEVVLDEIKLSAQKIQSSLVQLNALESVQYGQNTLPFKDIEDPQLEKQIAISWYGSVEPVLEKIAQLAEYKFEVFGKKPLSSQIIILGNSDAPVQDSALNILRNIAVQLKKQDALSINPQIKTISLRY